MTAASQIVSYQFITYPESDSSYITTHIIQIRTTQRRIIGFWTNTHTYTHTHIHACTRFFSVYDPLQTVTANTYFSVVENFVFSPNSTRNITVGVHNKPHICDVGEIRDVGERWQLVALGRSEPFTTNHICDAEDMSTKINIEETYICVDAYVSLHAYVLIIHICIHTYERVRVYVSWFTFGCRLWIFAYGHPSVVEYVLSYSGKCLIELMLFVVK